MNATMVGQSFLSLLDYTPQQIRQLLDLSLHLKAAKQKKMPHALCPGRSIAIVFEKSSTRTRCAFEVAAADLGIHPVYLDPATSQMGNKESLADTAKVLGRMFDGIAYRGFDQSVVQQLKIFSGVPVWNALTTQYHPTQALADLMTIQELHGSLAGKKVVFLGDARNNVANSLMIACAKMGMRFTACSPKAYFPEAALIETCQEIALETGAILEFEEDPMTAVEGAHVLYTDVWVSMGEPESVWAQRIQDLRPYQVTMQLLQAAGPDCVFLHCLPAFHDLNTTVGQQIYEKFGLSAMEVTDEAFSSPRSAVFQQAENRLHTIKAIMVATLTPFPDIFPD